MNILVIGSGGREHALIKKLKESPLCEQIYAAPGNGGIAADAICEDIPVTDIPAMTRFACEHSIGLAVVAPDDPLVSGMVDAMEEAGIPAFGPNKAAAIIEGSKSFAKRLMRDYNIPTADYAAFDDYDAACIYLKDKNSYPAVIKADGLALGKGVVIADDEVTATQALHSMMRDNVFGKSGSKVVIEEFLQGIEVSVLAFTDGEMVAPMVSSMDHKRAKEGDKGLNTGGMGTIAPHPLYTPEIAAKCMEEIYLPTIRAMNTEGRPFRGCLYFGLMLCKDGPKVIEYNCRFGDPETQVVLPLLEGDLVEIMLATRNQTLSQVPVNTKKGGAACVIMASGGYPTAYRKGLPIEGLTPDGQVKGATLYHSGTRLDRGLYLTNGGRVLGVSAVGANLKQALYSCYCATDLIHFEGSFYRRDIGAKVL